MNSRMSQENFQRSKAMTELQMAFDLKEGEVSNMFEGPAPLVKERDACGVGFIANTSSGGKIDERITNLVIKAIKVMFLFVETLTHFFFFYNLFH